MRSTTNPTALASWRIDWRRERGRSSESALSRSDWVCWNVRLKIMPLDPKIVAQYWIANWDDSTARHEKELSTWVNDVFYTAMELDPDYSFQLIEAIHEADSEQKLVEVFAAGPLEDLLVHHGPQVIERIEKKARIDPSFAHVLGGVWQNSMMDEVWQRVKVARVISNWADPAP